MKPNSIKILIRETNVNYAAWNLIAEGFLFFPGVKKYLGKAVTAGLQEIKNEAGQYGFDIENWWELGRRCIQRLENRTLSVQQLTLEHKIAGSNIIKLCAYTEKQNIEELSNLEIKRCLQRLWKPYLELNAIGFIPVVSDFDHNYFTNKLTAILRMQETPEDKIPNILSELITPTQKTLFWTEQKKLLKIALRYKTKTVIERSLEFRRHIRQYAWLNYGYQGPVWTERDFLDRVSKILQNKKSVSAQLIEHQSHLTRLKRKQKTIIKKLKLSDPERYLFNAARQFVYLKGYRVEVRHYFGYVSDLLFTEASRRFSLHPKFFRFCTREETMSVLEGKPVNKKAIVQRIHHTIEVIDHKQRKFYGPKQGRKILEKFVQKEAVAHTTDLKGQVAFAGHVRGQVKIVHSTKDLDKVRHGDVLVAITTNPDFLPAMYRANAFVTDVGGITSHAAIVAREMKKPCVIGTKFATKILRDGDTVEVDAAHGIVKIIKNHG